MSKIYHSQLFEKDVGAQPWYKFNYNKQIQRHYRDQLKDDQCIMHLDQSNGKEHC